MIVKNDKGKDFAFFPRKKRGKGKAHNFETAKGGLKWDYGILLNRQAQSL